MKKVFKFVKGKRDDKKESGGITPSQSGDLVSPAQTPEDERFLGLDTSSGYIVDFCGKDKTLTKLHKAAWQGSLDKLKSALKKVEIDTVDRHNRSALHFAVVQGHPNIVWFLLGNNAKMTICDDEGRTPLLKAVECGHKECMTLLLERGADINFTDYSGNSGLHIAAKQGSLDIASALLNRGADFEISNNCGEYPIHIATRSQNKDLVELLLRCGASVNVFDRENRTPLMLAAKTGNLLLAQLFFEYGAQLTVVDSNGWTAEDYALLGGHQNVAVELKALLKNEGGKSDVYTLETHNEEDEAELVKSNENSGTWNDSQLSEISEAKDPLSKKLHQFFKKCSDDDNDEKDKDEDPPDSPGSGVMPPPCQPPRSWEIIQAGMIDDNKEGSEPKRRSITTLGTLHSRRESFTEALVNNQQGEAPRYTLSLNRRKDVKRDNSFAKQRLSFNEEESLKSWINDDSVQKENIDHILNLGLNEPAPTKKRNSASDSDWDSDFSLSVDGGKDISKALSAITKNNKSISRATPVDLTPTDSESTESAKNKLQKLSDEGTLGRRETLQGVDEIWVANPHLSPESKNSLKKESNDVSSSWDSENSNDKDGSFPPPPTALELGVDMAKSMSFIKGVSIDHPPGSIMERNMWKSAYESQSHSLDCLDEKEKGSLTQLEKTVPSKRHARHQSISTQKWRSEEIPQCQRPVDRLVDVNRRINEQLECYDQALRELAESSYAKKQDALISTLTSEKSSKAQNYYSLPASKFKSGVEHPRKAYDFGPQFQIVKEGSGSHFIGNNNYYYDKPPFGSKPFIEMGSGPISLPFFVNDDDDKNFKSNVEKQNEVENNESLGLEESKADKAKQSMRLDFKPKEEIREVENLESPMSDDLSGSGTGSEKGEKKSKRHMLLAMRDVKHAVQVTNSFKSSLDDQILSPLTKTADSFDLDEKKLSPKATSSGSEGASPGDENPFFRGDPKLGALGRQETVIERTEFRRKSSSSDTGEEPTLWLQDEVHNNKLDVAKHNIPDIVQGTKAKHERMSSFSPLGAVYREIQAESRSEKPKIKKSGSSSSVEDSSSSPHSDKDFVDLTFTVPEGEGTPTIAALKRLERLGSSSSDGFSSRKDNCEDEEPNQENLPDLQSPDISLSSGPIEPLGASKDSGSEPESSHNEVTPTHNYSLKNHHEWLKNHLKTATTEKNKLEEIAVQLSEKAERLQYELADAKEAAKSRDEVIQLLQGQLARMETAYTRSLEESVHCRLQLTSHEQEILHLKELCFKYEEEKEKSVQEATESETAELKSRIKILEEDKERMRKEILRLEQEKNALEKRLQEATASELIDQCQRWKERCENLEESVKESDKKQVVYESYLKNMSQEHSEREDHLKERNIQLEKKLLEVNERNIELESRLCSIRSEMESAKRKNSVKEEINDSISELNKKNSELESQLRKFQKELEERNVSKLQSKEEEVQLLVEQFEKERQSLVKSYEKRLEEVKSAESSLELQNLKRENEKLKQSMKQMQEQYQSLQIKLSLEESNESLKSEISMLKDQCNTVTRSIADIQNKDKQELDTLMKENLNLKKEINELKIKLIKDDNDVPNFKLELLEIVAENAEIKREMLELKKGMQLLNETLGQERQLLVEYKLKNASLEQHIKKLSTDARQNQKTEGSSEQRTSKKREVGKQDELAWNNLYGIKVVGKMREEISPNDEIFMGTPKTDAEEVPENSKIEVGDNTKIEKLESELEKAKQDLVRQKLDLSFKSEEENKAREIRQNCELLELKRQVLSLQNRMTDEKSMRCALENKIAEISLDLKDKQRLEMEVTSLKRKLDREFASKSEIELLKYQRDLKSKRQNFLELGDAKSLDQDYKLKCEQLARERERSKEIRKKMSKKSNSFDPVAESPSGAQVKFHSFPRAAAHSEVLLKSRTFAPSVPLEPDLKSKLEDELDRSIRKYMTDYPSSTQSTSTVQIELLKKKYLH